MVRRSQNSNQQLEAGLAILLNIAKAEKVEIPYEAMVSIASHIDPNMQELKAALIRVVAYSSMINRNIDAGLVEEALQGSSTIKQRISKSGFYVRTCAIAAISSVVLLNGCSIKENVTPSSHVAMADSKVGSQQDITLTGRTEPFQQVLLSPSIEGNIKDIFVQVGAYVTKGQKLAQLDDNDLAYRVKQGEARVNSVQLEAEEKAIDQQISLNQSKVSLTTSSTSDIEQAKTAVKAAEIALADAQKNWVRTYGLFQAGAATQQLLDQANSQKRLAENQLDSAQKLVTSKASEQSDERQSALETANLQSQSNALAGQLTKQGIEQAKADLDVIKYQYNNLSLLAPIGGFVTDIKARLGSAVSPANPVFEITNLDQLYVKIDVPEALINRLKVGQKAEITFPILGKRMEGKITNIGLLADTSTSTATYPVRVLVDNAKHDVKGGMLAQVTFE